MCYSIRITTFFLSTMILASFGMGQSPAYQSIGDSYGYAASAQYTVAHNSPPAAPFAAAPPVGPNTMAAPNEVHYLADRLNQVENQLYSMSQQSVIGSCGCECNCDRGEQCCDVRGGFYAGAGVVFAKPNFKEAFQFSQTNVFTGQQTLFPFEYDYETTPRAWFGYKLPGGTGLLARYWQFDGEGQSSFDTSDGFNIYGAHAVTIIFPANIFAAMPGESLATQNSLATEILDLLGTIDIDVPGVEATGGFGLRYAKLEQAISAQVLNGGIPTAFMDWVRAYEGLGPTVTFDGKKQLGASPLSVFLQGGGAFLFGTKSINRTVIGDQSPQPASPFLSLEGADEVVGIGELSIGFELEKNLRNGSQFLLRSSYEGSLWAEAGAPTLGFLGFEGFGITAELRR